MPTSDTYLAYTLVKKDDKRWHWTSPDGTSTGSHASRDGARNDIKGDIEHRERLAQIDAAVPKRTLAIGDGKAHAAIDALLGMRLVGETAIEEFKQTFERELQEQQTAATQLDVITVPQKPIDAPVYLKYAGWFIAGYKAHDSHFIRVTLAPHSPGIIGVTVKIHPENVITEADAQQMIDASKLARKKRKTKNASAFAATS